MTKKSIGKTNLLLLKAIATKKVCFPLSIGLLHVKLWTIYVPESDTIHRSMDHIWSFTYTNNSAYFKLSVFNWIP